MCVILSSVLIIYIYIAYTYNIYNRNKYNNDNNNNNIVRVREESGELVANNNNKSAQKRNNKFGQTQTKQIRSHYISKYNIHTALYNEPSFAHIDIRLYRFPCVCVCVFYTAKIRTYCS